MSENKSAHQDRLDFMDRLYDAIKASNMELDEVVIALITCSEAIYKSITGDSAKEFILMIAKQLERIEKEMEKQNDKTCF